MRRTGRILSILIVLVLFCSAFPGRVQAEPDTSGCRRNGTHEWELTQTITEPTCESEGSGWYVCKHCGAGTEGSISALGHSAGEAVHENEKAATCTAAGSYDSVTKCTRCGKELSRTHIDTPALGHSFGDWSRETEPTCTAAGKETRTCTRCGASESREVAALGHPWDAGTVTKAATCTAEGVKTFTCTRCGGTRTEVIPKTEHTAETLPAKEATCEEAGLTEGQRCQVCGEVLKAQETVPAKGHDWDEGQITQEPEGMKPGVRTYTCKNDPSHTRTEEIKSSSKDLFMKLRNLPPAGMGPDPLQIIRQPEGGKVPLFGPESHELSISLEAGGGVEPYTYEWHFRKTVREENMDAEAEKITGYTEGALYNILNRYQSAKANWSAVWSELYEKKTNEPLEITQDDEYLLQLMNINDEYFSYINSPEIKGHGGNIYYCVVTDAFGNRIATDLAPVEFALSISRQPENTNTETDGDRLTCEAHGGVPPYTYTWYLSTKDPNGSFEPVEDSNKSELPILSHGYYYCEVTDSEDGHVRSNIACAYKVDPLEFVYETPDQIREGETVGLDVEVTGGVPPYTGYWSSWESGVYEGLEPVQDEDGSHHYRATADKPDTWYLSVTDSMGKEIDTTIEVEYRQLKIGNQPKGGVLPVEGGMDIRVDMAEGTAPYKYELYQMFLGYEENGFEEGWLVDSGDSKTFHIEEEGTYYIIITDTEGRWAKTNFVQIRDYDFRITSFKEEAKITQPDGQCWLHVSFEGGKSPYTFVWYRQDPSTGEYAVIPGDTNSNYYLADNVGYYACVATDGNNVSDSVYGMKVTYSGKNPIITVQPEDVTVESGYDKGDWPAVELTCEAASGSGDDSQLQYVWRRKDSNGSWQPIGTGKKIKVQGEGTAENQTGGQYSCRVFDNSTRESIHEVVPYTDSNIVTVTVQMEVIRAEQSGTSKTIELEIAGGTYPYTIKCVHLCQVDSSEYFSDPARKWNKDSKKPASNEWDAKEEVLRLTYNKIDRYRDYQGHRYPYTYYFRITDATGQVLETQVTCAW